MFLYRKTDKEHDRNLTNFLNIAGEHGLKIGADKIQYKKISIEFYGLQFMTDGYRPTDKKIHDIQLIPEPKEVTQLQSFLGMVTYLNRYSPRLTEITAPLQDLIKDNVPFIWGPKHPKAFHATSQEIQSAPLLVY